MEYELINTSDPYTFITDDFEVAAIVVFSLGAAYGATPKHGGEAVPIFIFGGALDWYIKRFGRMPHEGMKAKKKAVSEALESLMLGRFKDRRKYNAALSAITDPKKKAEFIATWEEDRTTRINLADIAHTLARVLKKTGGTAT